MGASGTALLECRFYGCLVPHLYNCERPHSSLDYRTPEEFRQNAGYANVESKERFPHLHSLDGGCEIVSESNQNRETPVISG